MGESIQIDIISYLYVTDACDECCVGKTRLRTMEVSKSTGYCVMCYIIIYLHSVTFWEWCLFYLDEGRTEVIVQNIDILDINNREKSIPLSAWFLMSWCAFMHVDIQAQVFCYSRLLSLSPGIDVLLGPWHIFATASQWISDLQCRNGST